MALNDLAYRSLVLSGIPHYAALVLADPALDTINGGVVTNPAALTSTAPGAAYVQGEATAVRTDLAALQATVTALTAALRTAGVVS